MSILIGTSGWHYPTGKGTWTGIFYPERRPRGFDELAYYAERFSTVEINATFYRPLEPDLSAAWIRRTPPGFQFAVKLYQKFTHPDMYLARPGATNWDVTRGDVDEFRRGLDPMVEAGRLAALLVQFPASFHADPDTREYLDWIGDVFRGYPLAIELRHRTWSDTADETRTRLAAIGASWVVIDEPKFHDSVRQSLDVPGSDLLYLRLHGRNAAQWWEPDERDDRYDYLYSGDELRPFADAARAASKAGRRVLMYMNNHFSAKAVANAAVLRHQLGDLLPGDYPAEMVKRYPELNGIARPAAEQADLEL
jgi:uncharacterized protein YecE (DUF72 family)